MNLIATKALASNKKAARDSKTKAQSRFERYWKLAQKANRQNEKLHDQLRQMKKRYQHDVLPSEMLLNEQICAECYRLMGFFNRKSLRNWERETLAEWIACNIEMLLNQPSFPPATKAKLSADFMELIKPFASEEVQPEEPEAAPDCFDEEDGDGDSNNQQQQQTGEHFFDEEDFAEFNAQKAREAEKNKAAERLFKKTSINTMFRRIARILHPDLEMDPSKREEKHHLMSKLVKAREHQDIITLFQMHREFVSELPPAMEDDELERVTQLLQHQIHNLECDKEKIIFQDPQTAEVYSFFEGKTEKQIAKEIKARVQALKQSTYHSRMLVNHLRNLKKLKPLLEQRYLASMGHDRY